MSGSGEVSLPTFITSMSGSKSLMSFAYRFFHFRRPSGLRLAFDATKRNEKLAAFSAKEVKQLHRKEKETSISMQKDSERRSKRQSYPELSKS